MGVIERWYMCQECGRVGPMADFQDECRPGLTHGKLWGVDLESPVLRNARGAVDALRWALGFIEYQGEPSPLDDPREGEADAESYRRALAIVGGQ
jgi:hypothetical protein